MRNNLIGWCRYVLRCGDGMWCDVRGVMSGGGVGRERGMGEREADD